MAEKKTGGRTAVAEDLDKLIEQGRQKGFLTYEELNEFLPNDIVSPEYIDEVLLTLDEKGVELVDERDLADEDADVILKDEEEPVEEDIRLREEQVHVERRPVDRPAGPEDIDRGLREETIELRESSEEPVVSKEARVTEEIDIGKETTEHVETIRDTERRTEAEIEDLGTTGTARTTGTTARGTDIDETPFRQHYQTSFAGRGYDFDHYLPAYRYGAELARSSRFRNKGWDDVMPEAQKSWESRNPGTWNDYMDAVREGFTRTSGRSMARGR